MSSVIAGPLPLAIPPQRLQASRTRGATPSSSERASVSFLRRRRQCAALGRVPQCGVTVVSSANATANRGTVAALATAVVPQAGGVAIVRMSGPDAVRIARDVFQPGQPNKQRPQKGKGAWKLVSHTALYGGVYDKDGQLIDEARPCIQLPRLPASAAFYATLIQAPCPQVLVLPMLAPRSYTKEDVIEIHCHGGSVCARSVLQTCTARSERPLLPAPPHPRLCAGRVSRAAAAVLCVCVCLCTASMKRSLLLAPPPRWLLQSAGAELAEPGEFTLRAFLNGERDAPCTCGCSCR